MSEGPESLSIHVAGRRIRGVLRLERQEAKMRPFFFGLIAFAFVAAGSTMAPPDIAPYAFVLAFLVLVGTVPFGMAVLNPPQDLNLDDHLLQLGHAEIPLARIEKIELREDGRTRWLTIHADGEPHTWPLSATSHSLEDVQWLVHTIEARIPGDA
ncbi:MAG: hypothetical protein EP330_24095 [Deltaproteobacteria bacterium]|nr:MAG: hypothetical protein EP330_24095 [Deltaproteobacteria bacterium]